MFKKKMRQEKRKASNSNSLEEQKIKKNFFFSFNNKGNENRTTGMFYNFSSMVIHSYLTVR